MIRKFISITAILLAAVCMNLGAQELQSCRLNSNRVAPKMSKLSLNDGEFWWGYYDGTFDNCQMIGVGENTKIPQSYSAATCILTDNEDVKGKSISGISFSFPSSKNITDVKVWISESLPSSPDNASIFCQEVKDIVGYNVEEYQFNEVRFEKPYFFDGSKDIYVGYSFVVSENEGQFDMFPIFTTGLPEVHTRALMIKCGKAQWRDYMTKGFGDLAVRFLISGGTFEDNNVRIQSTFGEVSAIKNTEVKIPVEVENLGGNGITSLGLTIDIAGSKEEITVTPENKISGIGTKYNFDLVFNAPDNSFSAPVKITVDKVNGAANNCADREMNGNMYILSRKAERKVLFEEFTATWCGFCPRGAVGIAKAKQVYGEKIVPIAVHYQDEMDCPNYFQLIKNTVEGFPGGHIDRKYMGVDPYFGNTGNVKFAVSKLIDDCLEDTPKAELTADAVIDGDILTARAEYRFLYDGKADCAVAYVVTQDSIKNDEWWQGNNYSGAVGFEDEPLFEQWVNAGKHAKGIVYNEVAVVAEGVYPYLNGSVPSEVKAEELMSHEITINLSDYPLVMDRNKLNLCVFMIDRSTGRVVNADSKSLNPTTGIENVEVGNIKEISRYTVDGRQITVPEKGLNIVKYSDGSVRKIIVR